MSYLQHSILDSVAECHRGESSKSNLECLLSRPNLEIFYQKPLVPCRLIDISNICLFPVDTAVASGYHGNRVSRGVKQGDSKTTHKPGLWIGQFRMLESYWSEKGCERYKSLETIGRSVRSHLWSSLRGFTQTNSKNLQTA